MATKIRPAEPVRELVPADDPYPLPSTSRIMPITPEMASSWVSYRNHPRNRTLSKSVSGRYQSDMEAGRWREATPEGLIFDTDGWGISFQHRMKALANVSEETLIGRYGHPWLSFWVFVNEPREIFEVVDAGYKRTAAHLLRVPYASNLGNAARHLAALADGDRWGMPRFGRITTPEIVDTFHAWPELTWHAKELHRTCLDWSIPLGPHAAVLAQAERTEYHEKVEGWVKGILSGANLADTDPRLHLHRRFKGGGPAGSHKRDVTYALIVKAWNAWAQQDPVTVLRHMHTEAMPKVIGYDSARNGRAAA
jgi:hypothetical protein